MFQSKNAKRKKKFKIYFLHLFGTNFDEVFESVVVQFNFHEVLRCFESSLLLLLMCCAVVVVRQVLLLPAYNLEVIPEVLPSWSQHKIGCI